MNFDPEQQEAIHSQGNTAVSAGAGSGKTSVLAERFCWLLAHKGARVDQILTLTFTQKAAAEMYEKIYGRLMAAEDPELRGQLEGFDQAQISTLDSFCAQIVRNSSALFGLAPDFSYDEETLTRMADDSGLDFILNNLDKPALQELLRIHGFEKTWKNLFSSLANRELHLGDHGNKDLENLAEVQLEFCRKEIRKEAGRWQEICAKLLALPSQTASIRRSQQALLDLPDLTRFIDGESYTALLELLKDFRLNKPGGVASEDILQLKSLIDTLRNKVQTIRALAGALTSQELLRGSFHLIERFHHLFLTKKREASVVSFRDTAELSVQALILNKALRSFYKKKYRYIMIDEFQDNNRLQRDLLYLLAEKRDLNLDRIPGPDELEADKLFFVGDEKQSIYRFRGADVRVFKSLSSELIRAGGKSLTLSRNYRSAPGLIHFFNSFFSRVMGDSKRSFEARYSALKPGSSATGYDPGPQTSPPEVHFFYKPYCDNDQEFSNEESEAYCIAQVIKDAVENKKLDIGSSGSSRPAEFEDFTLLLRSTGKQISYERMFRFLNVPFSTQNVRSLFVEPPINDIYALLQLAAYPQDRSAYATLLRSPLVNVSDEALARLLLAGRPPFEGTETLKLGREDRDRLGQGLELYRSIAADLDRRPLTELIHRIWYRGGYRYYILQQPRYHNYLEYYDYLIRMAERADRDGVAGFLDFLRDNLGKYEKIEDINIPEDRSSGVQIMSIHKAKGLEFPIVVLADTGNSGRGSGHTSPYYISEDFGITLNLGPENIFTRIGEQEREQKELAELKRLLYVALTRTKDHLFILGSHNRNNRNSDRVLLNQIFHGLGENPETLEEGPTQSLDDCPYVLKIKKIEPLTRDEFLKIKGLNRKIDPEVLQPAYAAAQIIQRRCTRREYSVTELVNLLRSGAVAAKEGRQLQRMQPLLQPALEIDPLLQQKRLESNFGSLVHLLISRSLQPGQVMEEDWRLLNIPRENREQLLTHAERLCHNFLRSLLGSKASEASRLHTEYPFLYLWKSTPLYISGQIDLLFETAEGLTLVDFKTDRMYYSGEYLSQLGLYTLAAEELFPGRQVAAYLFLLRGAETISLEKVPGWRTRLTTSLLKM